jgi:MoaA/NifB/PqqE/SkfB family radical SAM enzyme
MPDTLPLVTLYLSERCNSRCVTCDYWRHGAKDATLESVERMLPSLVTLRTRAVLLSGGEPLLNPEWQQIAALLKSNGLALWLLTSGLSLAKHAERAVELFDSITVSLDGTCSQTYAAIRGVDAFAKVCEGISAVASAGVPTSVRVTLQRANYRELLDFVALAHELGAAQISFLAVDVANAHAFARHDASTRDLALRADDLSVLDELLDSLEREHAMELATRFIAESPAKLRRLRDYFAALLGLAAFPAVRCNAPDFSAVVDATGRVAPCFFIPAAPFAPRAPDLAASLASNPARALRAAIRAGARRECARCVCSMWREPAAFTATEFRLGAAADA